MDGSAEQPPDPRSCSDPMTRGSDHDEDTVSALMLMSGTNGTSYAAGAGAGAGAGADPSTTSGNTHGSILECSGLPTDAAGADDDAAAEEEADYVARPEPNIKIESESEEEVPQYSMDPTAAEEEGGGEAMDYAVDPTSAAAPAAEEEEDDPMEVEVTGDETTGDTATAIQAATTSGQHFVAGSAVMDLDGAGAAPKVPSDPEMRQLVEEELAIIRKEDGPSDDDEDCNPRTATEAATTSAVVAALAASSSSASTRMATRSTAKNVESSSQVVQRKSSRRKNQVSSYATPPLNVKARNNKGECHYNMEAVPERTSKKKGGKSKRGNNAATNSRRADRKASRSSGVEGRQTRRGRKGGSTSSTMIAAKEEEDFSDVSMPPTAVEATATGTATGIVPSTAKLVSSTDSSPATSPSATEGNRKTNPEEKHKLAHIEALLAQDKEKNPATCATEIQENVSMDTERPTSGIEFSTDDEQCGSGDDANEDDRHANESMRELEIPVPINSNQEDTDQEVEQNSTASPLKIREKSRVETVTQCGSCANCFVDDCGECDVCIARQNPGKGGGRGKCIHRTPCLVKPGKKMSKEVTNLLEGDKAALIMSNSRRRGRKRKSGATGTDGTDETYAMLSGEASSSAANTGTRKSHRNSDKAILDVKKGQQKILDEIQATKSAASSTSRKSKRPSRSVAMASPVQNIESESEEEGWICPRCEKPVDASKKRCRVCRSWKGGTTNHGNRHPNFSPISPRKTSPKKPPARKAKQSPEKPPAKKKAPKKSSDIGNQGTETSAKKSSNIGNQGKGTSAKTKTVTVKAMIGNEEVWTEKKEAALQANSDTANSFSASTVSAAASSEVAADVELEKLEEVEDLPEFPDTGRCTWSFDKTSRVLLASFVFDSRDIKDMDKRDKEFLLRMMERDDITVISEGLAFGFDPDMWKLEFISDLIGDEFCHKVRRFRRQILPMPEGTDADGAEANASYVTYKEKNGYETMKMKDYVLYLNQRGKALERLKLARQDKMPDALNPSNKEDDQIGRDEDEDTFGYTNHNERERKVNVIDDVLYLTDYDFVKMLPTLFEDLKNNFKLTECLPGGERCMMHCVNANGRPFMGPNLYVTPPASFTHFHQDGHGTVDSGHLCLSGYNEVIMLRRMPEAHKHHALSILNGDDAGSRDALYVLPHDDNGEKPPWPTQDAIDQCKEMGYYPSVFVLKPGQFVHINKGRLHAFRKLAPTTLPSSDCHAKLRAQIHKETGAASTTEMLCISVAWDWLYQGFTSEGINREIVSTLECAKLNRQNLCRSLAIPETSILHMARHYVTKREHEIKANNPEAREQAQSFLMYPTSKTASSSVPSSSTSATDAASVTAVTSSSGDQATSDGKSGLEVEPAPVIKGLLPSLSHIVDRHKAAHDRMQEEGASFNVKMARRPNAHENPDEPGIDPYSNGDFECLLCFEAISNVYMHCTGCETLLHKDFNICVACHAEGKHKCVRQMNSFSKAKLSMLNHVGNNVRDRGRGCSCKQGACKHCGYCQACSCKCHDKFTMQLRFMSIDDEVKLLERVKDAVGSDKLPDDPTLKKLQAEEQKLLENVVLVEDPGEEEEKKEEKEDVEMQE